MSEREWLKVRRQWIKDNPPNHEGYYECYICKKWVLANEITLDHIRSRSRHPELLYDRDNLAPCCYSCNFKKGST